VFYITTHHTLQPAASKTSDTPQRYRLLCKAQKVVDTEIMYAFMKGHSQAKTNAEINAKDHAHGSAQVCKQN
jgi:hypothetical protein